MERASTPIEWLAKLIGKRKSDQRFIPKNWAVMLYQILDRDEMPEVGLAAVTGESTMPQAVMVFRDLPEDVQLTARLFTRRHDIRFAARVYDGRRLDSPISPLYLYRLADIRSTVDSICEAPGHHVSSDDLSVTPSA